MAAAAGDVAVARRVAALCDLLLWPGVEARAQFAGDQRRKFIRHVHELSGGGRERRARGGARGRRGHAHAAHRGGELQPVAAGLIYEDEDGVMKRGWRMEDRRWQGANSQPLPFSILYF